ncbi:alpha/beta hydrolase [Mesobacillus subterraneus]|uniref:alpha/beta hydrolase n=1 Tax=Mesobacillus subterraneus TaxID=285983 RepID=UPI001CFF189B|nr:alpha/beta hydrolase [Mesobacillus subterraneus]WLR57339.1 alpha/beta hydrolase [Mesobacillus subterraneus]
MKRENIAFTSEGVKCKGWLYLPENASEENKVPAIVMAHGFSLVKEAYLDRYAKKFSQAGMAVLVFDYRNFGESEGSKRQHLDPSEQIKDYRNAISWVSRLSQINKEKIGIWGTSYSGGHVLHIAAIDKRVKAVVSQVPTINGWRGALRKMGKEKMEKFIQQLIDYRESRYDNKKQQYIKVVAVDGQAAQPHPDCYNWFLQTHNSIAPNWENRITLESMEKYLEYDPAGLIDLISPTPLLMIAAMDDKITPPDMAIEAFDKRAREPKKIVKLPGGHFDVYNGETFTEASDAAVQWFTTHLIGKEIKV